MPENVLVVNTEGPETRVGVLENGKLLAASDLVGCPRSSIYLPLVSW